MQYVECTYVKRTHLSNATVPMMYERGAMWESTVVVVARLIYFDCGEDNNARAEGTRQCARCRIAGYVEAKAAGHELQKKRMRKL